MGISKRLLISALLVGVLGSAAAVATWSAFSATTDNAANSFAAGTVAISGNDAGSAMLSLTEALPGDSTARCMLITYTGSLDAGVRLYGAVAGTLAPALTLTVTRGTESSPSFSVGCETFTPDATNYLGFGPGVVFAGALSSYPSSYDTGIVDPNAGGAETWTTSESHSYKFSISVDPAAGTSLSATATFSWEARNL